MTTLPALPPTPAPGGAGLTTGTGAAGSDGGVFAGILGAGAGPVPGTVVVGPVPAEPVAGEPTGTEEAVASEPGPGPSAAQIIVAAQVTPVGPMLANAPRLAAAYGEVATGSTAAAPAAEPAGAPSIPVPGGGVPSPVVTAQGAGAEALAAGPTGGSGPTGQVAGMSDSSTAADPGTVLPTPTPTPTSSGAEGQQDPTTGQQGTGQQDTGPHGMPTTDAAPAPAAQATASSDGGAADPTVGQPTDQAGATATAPRAEAPTSQPTTQPSTQPTAAPTTTVNGLTATGPATPTTGATSAASPVAGQVFPEVTRLVSRGDGTRRITLQLSPEALGDVRVVLTVRNGEVQVRMSGGEQAQQALLAGAPELHRLLDLAGATSSQIQVGTQSSTSALDQHLEQGLDQHAMRQDARSDGEHPQDHRTAGTRDGDTSARDGAPRGTHPHPATNPGTRTRIAGVDVTM